MYMPDYQKLKASLPFTCTVSSTYLALLEATGIPVRDMFLEPEAGIELYRRGPKLIRELYGDQVNLPKPSTAPISYGHLNTLGAELIFPEGGEVNHGTLVNSLAEGVELLKKTVDFPKCGMFPYYLRYYEEMQKAFPDTAVNFAFKYEGPMTTGYLLRRDAFFYDPYDEPELTKEFLRLITDSVVAYFKCLQEVIYHKPVTGPLPQAAIADDIGAMFNPGIWDEFVMPYYNRFFEALTDGKRIMHIEDLRPEHLPYLQKLGLEHYDPSVSPRLTPAIISAAIDVPFNWRLCNFQYPQMTVKDVENWVFRAAADGASGVFTLVCHGMYNAESVPKVHAFQRAGAEVIKALEQGATRADLRKFITD